MFHCQQDSLARRLEALVVSCTPATRTRELQGKKAQVAGWEVVCQDTVLFPEGGGQNCDQGQLGGRPVLEVTRVGETAVHFVTGEEVEVGSRVEQVVDWERRWDHMQQHSGQHLLSAVLERSHGTNTLSWWMAETARDKVGVSYIEVDRPPGQEVLHTLEAECNKVIRDALPVTVQLLDIGDPALDTSHTRGLPADHTGQVRLVTIPGVDANLCCGTHVPNTSCLQVVKVVGGESRKGKHWVHFLVGDRVTAHLAHLLDRERALTKVLNNAPEEHLQLVTKMQRSLKAAQRISSSLLKEVAAVEAMRAREEARGVVVVHRKDGDSDYINTFLKELNDQVRDCAAVLLKSAAVPFATRGEYSAFSAPKPTRIF